MAKTEDVNIKKCHFSFGKEKNILESHKTLQQLVSESDQVFRSRNEVFAECWSAIDSQIQDIVCTEHRKVIKDVLLFLSNSKQKLDQLQPSSPAHSKSSQVLAPSLELFTAAVMAGANLSDHQGLFQQLTEELQARTTPHLVTLTARVCNSGIKATMKSIISQLMMSDDQGLSGSEEDEHFPVPRSGRKKIKSPHAKKTVSDSDGSDDDVPLPKSKRRALFKSPQKTESSSQVRTPPSKRIKNMEDEPTPRSTRASRSHWKEDEATTPRKTMLAPSKGTRTPRSKKSTYRSDDSEYCHTPHSTRTPVGGFTTPRSSRRILAGKDVAGTPRSSKRTGRRQPPYSMSTLCGWYRETAEERACREPVVLFIEDFEEFSSKILQDLILSLIPHLTELPVVLVLGMATPVNTLHHTLPHHVVSCLSIQEFSLQQSPVTLSSIISNVLMSPALPVKLGPRAFKFLTDNFLQTNFSLTGFRRGLKLALMEHFYWQPLSVLCSTSTLEGKKWPTMLIGFCECVRATPSFQKYVESMPPSQRLSLLTKNAAVVTAVQEMTRAMREYHQALLPLLRCLYHFTCSLPDAPLGDKLQDLYVLSLQQDIVEDSKFKSAWALVNMLGKDHLNRIVQLCMAELRDVLASGVEIALLQDTYRIFSKYEDEVGLLATGEGVTKHVGIPSRSSFDILRKKFLPFVLTTFSKLRPPHTFPLHEAFYFNQETSLQRHLTPTPRSCLQRALTCPSYYISPQQKKKSKQAGAAMEPDLCVLYSMYLESGKLISINDWLQSFAAVVQQDGGGKKHELSAEGTAGKRAVDSVLQDRFHQALSELQLLGYVRQTQRKVDHLQRLTLEQAKDEYTL